MRCSKSNDLRGAPRPSYWLLACAMVLIAAPVGAEGFDVHHAQVRLSENVYRLDCDFDVALSDEALEALDNGVALTVTVDLKVVRRREVLWDDTVAALEARYRLQVHPLSGRYLLENLNSGASRSFRNLGAALDALGSIRDFPLLDAALLDPDLEHELRLRVRLDIESLPAPLRLLAYFSSRWRLQSEWTQWPVPR